MNEFEILLTVMISGFGFMGSIMLLIWRRIDQIENRLTKLEHDMIEVKTILRMKEGCMINDDKRLPKAE